MSNNIIHWKTREIRNLIIPISPLYSLPADLRRKGWGIFQICIVDVNTQCPPGVLSVAINRDGEGYSIEGILERHAVSVVNEEYYIIVGAICVEGEGSGMYWGEMILPALRQSTGDLTAILVWDSGDVEKIEVHDGIITTQTLGE